jgi:hypothetical protein
MSGFWSLFPRAHINYVFNYQSQSFDLSEWLSLFTLCLAPLIVHILIGVPDPIILRGPRPGWTDRICHFNPTSIYWRYYIITSRRFTSNSWDSADMAASNAIFWTGPVTRWDGSEHMMKHSRNFCTRLPEHHRISLLSTSSMKTLLTAIQGAQAISTLCMGWRGGTQTTHIALPTIFLSCAIFGLFRLPAALWLSDSYGYADLKSWDPLVLAQFHDPSGYVSTIPAPIQHHPLRARWSIAIKALFILPPVGLLGLLCLYYVPTNENQVFTATDFMTNLFYLCFLLPTIISTAICMYLDRTDSTVFPSIDSTWYRIYTVVLYLMALIYFIFAAIETRRTPCGVYTTYPATRQYDDLICN